MTEPPNQSSIDGAGVAGPEYTRAPNEDVAAAVDALARQVPHHVPVDLLVLGSDTIRAALSGRGRAMDVTRPRGAER